jgi:hypothetical protein
MKIYFHVFNIITNLNNQFKEDCIVNYIWNNNIFLKTMSTKLLRSLLKSLLHKVGWNEHII